jgi:alcohol dehydrogenase, propanol-preferring
MDAAVDAGGDRTTMTSMVAWQVTAPGRLERTELPRPRPERDELLVHVRACGVCRTDLHVRDFDLAPHKSPVVPGHEVVGEVVATGSDVAREWTLGRRVGVAWLRRTCGQCRWCVRGMENLCPESMYTGWDADGGYAEYVTVPAEFAYPLPFGYDDLEAAPLLCAGIIGYRALRRAELPKGGRLGLYGFGASAHLTAQLALAEGATVHVLTRAEAARQLALQLGVTSVGGAYDSPPEPLDSAILFAPVGDLVPFALAALDRGGTLSIAGIHLSQIPPLDYHQHLFAERQIRSVMANTRQDGVAFLDHAARHQLRIAVTPYRLDAAAEALDDLAADRIHGVGVLEVL